MRTFDFTHPSNKTLLALGPESAGNFSIFRKNKIYFSEDFGDLLDDTNYQRYKREAFKYLKKNNLKPDIIITDLHPLYKSTALGQTLSKKYKTRYIQTQHHLAHIFSAIGDKMISDKLGLEFANRDLRDAIGIALDGTGYGLDGKIWGGEIFSIQAPDFKNKKDDAEFKIKRIGKLENQTLLGGDLAIREPARFLLAILNKFTDKNALRARMKKFYSEKEFEVLLNQLRQNFNCQETSSAGRVIDAVSILLGFAENTRQRKHEAADILEKNSAAPRKKISPEIIYSRQEKLRILQTTPLFEYLVENMPSGKKNRERLSAAAQFYIARGLYKIVREHYSDSKHNKKFKKSPIIGRKSIFAAGGISNNKIISAYLESKGAYVSKKIPRGDAGLSVGQIFCCLLTDPRN